MAHSGVSRSSPHLRHQYIRQALLIALLTLLYAVWMFWRAVRGWPESKPPLSAVFSAGIAALALAWAGWPERAMVAKQVAGQSFTFAKVTFKVRHTGFVVSGLFTGWLLWQIPRMSAGGNYWPLLGFGCWQLARIFGQLACLSTKKYGSIGLMGWLFFWCFWR